MLGGLGVAIISTSQGLLTDRQARKRGRGRGSPRLGLVRETEHMSRIGRKPIPVPAGVDITIDGQTVTVKGPKGELSHTVAEPITVERGEDGILVRRAPQRRAQGQGAARPVPHPGRQHGRRGDRGLPQGLEIDGTGYRVAAEGRGPRVRARLLAPGARAGARRASRSRSSGRRCSTSPGIDKQQVGEVAANIRKIRPPEPYKGKGVQVPGRGHPPQGRKGR